MDDTDHDKREAELLARLEAERETRIAEKIAAGEIVSVQLCIVAGSESELLARVEEAKTAKLKELHDGGDQREVVFRVNTVVTGVVQHGEIADPASVPRAPGFFSQEDVPVRPPLAAPLRSPIGEVVEEAREKPQPPVIETYVCVQVRQCQDDDDPGEIAEGWYSVDGKVLTVTDANGRHVGSRAMLQGEDARVVAKQLLRGKKVPESEDFNRRLSYPNMGMA